MRNFNLPYSPGTVGSHSHYSSPGNSLQILACWTALHNLGHTDDRFFSQVQLGKPVCLIPALIRVAVAVSGSRQDMQSLSETLTRSVTLSSGYCTIIGLSHGHLSGLELEDVHETRQKSCVARSQHTSPSMFNMA
ncbi:hypothetical protein J6590_062541 [Homalodisca vitripennis]|nr:hypothetical protein J6590_062541 [Homalodisca vitripennis]